MSSYNDLRITLPTGEVFAGLHVGTIPKNSTAPPNEMRRFYGVEPGQPAWDHHVAAQPYDRYRIQPHTDAAPFVVAIVDGTDIEAVL